MKNSQCPTALRHKSSETRGPTQTPTFWQWLQWLRPLCQTQQWPPSETNIWWTTTNTATDGSSHCKLTIWKVSPQNTQHCCRDPDLEGPADPNTQWVWWRAQWWDSATSIWSHHNNAVSATNGWQHSTSTKMLPQQQKSWPHPTNCFSNKRLTAATTTWRKNLQHCEV